MKSRIMAYVAAALILILNIFDAAISVWFTINLVAEELNPVMAEAIKSLGYSFIIPKAALAVLVGILLIRHWTTSAVARIGGIIVLIVYALVFAYHIWGLANFT